MFFGKTTFAEDSFASQGINDVSVSVTGQSLSTAIGTETAFTNVTATPTGIALSSAIGTATAAPETIATPTGIAMSVNIATPGVLAWSPVGD